MRSLVTFLVVTFLIVGATRTDAEVGAVIEPGDQWRYRVGNIEPPANWNSSEFDDTDWKEDRSGFSFGFGSYEEATRPPEFSGFFRSLYIRRTFLITNVTEMAWPVLRIDYDDGFVAYLNGTEIARRGMDGEIGESVPYDAASTLRPRSAAEEIDLRPFLDQFQAGTNVLAIQVHKTGIPPDDLTIAVIPELLSGITRGPFLQSTTTNSTTVVVRTAVSSSMCIEYGTTPELGTKKCSLTSTNQHTITLTGLMADTEYFYRARMTGEGGENVTGIFSLRTLKHQGSTEFLVLGDSGVGQTTQYQIADQIAVRETDLVLHAGDIVYPQFTDGRADSKLFSVYHESMRSVPWFFAIGNHDLYAGESHYLNAFHLPENSPVGGERYYSFDHGDVHFSVLMIPYLSQYKITPGDPQYQWLVDDLSSSTKPWKVLLFHVPMQTSANHRVDDKNLNGRRDSEEIREVLLPVAQEHGVQVVFSGHDHVFERFAPTNGVHALTTGGGGVGLYSFVERDLASVQFWRRHHFLDVTVVGDRMEIRAIDSSGTEFDSQVIHRTPPLDVVHQSTWHTPVVESSLSNDGDGNIGGQRFDLIGQPIATMPGESHNLGELHVNNDRSHLHLGVSRMLLRKDSVVYLFIDSPRQIGVTTLAGLGDGVLNPAEQGADGLDLLENLSFAELTPSVGIILGDETADNTYRSFQREAQSLNTGQGMFLLNASLDEVGGRLQQFNRSPQIDVVTGEGNSDFVEISVPYSALGNLLPGDIIRVGAVVAGDGHDPVAQVQYLDKAFLGTAMTGAGTNAVVLSGVRVQLALDADRDGDGLPNDWELANNFDPDSSGGINGSDGDIDGDGADNLHEFMAGTNPRDSQSVFTMWQTPVGQSQTEIHWKTEPGLIYHLETASGGSVRFLPHASSYFPKTATGSEDSFTNQNASSVQIFRVKRMD